MYSLVDIDGEENKKAKQVNKSVGMGIRHKNFLKRIQSKLYRIGTYDVCKISLSCFDDKRYILDDGINSLADFHKDARSQ